MSGFILYDKVFDLLMLEQSQYYIEDGSIGQRLGAVKKFEGNFQ